MAGLACVLAAAALAAGCVPALNYGSVPPEPEYTTKLTTTTAGSTTRKPFTTNSHKERTISWAEYSGTRAHSTTTRTGTGTSETGTNTGTYTGTGSNITGTGSDHEQGSSGSGHTTDMPQTITSTVHSGDVTDPPTPPPTDPPQTTPAQTAPPQTAPPQTVPAQDE